MHKNKYALIRIFFFSAVCAFAACKKDLKPGENMPLTVSNSKTLTGGNGQLVTIKGSNLMSNGVKPTVSLNKKQLTLALATNDSLVVVIPKLIGSGKFLITSSGQTFEGPQFTYQYYVTVTTIAGTDDFGTKDGPAKSASFYCPWGITADQNGDLYIADCYNRLVRKYSVATNTVSSITIPVTVGGNDFFSPYNIALNKATHDLYVTDFNAHLLKIAGNGDESVIYNGPMTTTGIALGADGFLYMTNNIKNTMLKLTTSGDSVARYNLTFGTPRNIIFDAGNNMYVAGYDYGSSMAAIYKVDNMGNSSVISEDKAFGGWEIAVDEIGNFYEADHFHNVIRMIDLNGNVITLAGNGVAHDVDGIGTDASFDGPQGLTIDAQGNLYVTTFNYTDNTGNKVRKIVVQ